MNIHDFKPGTILCFQKDSNISGFLIGSLISLAEELGDTDNDNYPIDPDRIVHAGMIVSNEYFIESVSSGVRLQLLSQINDVWVCSLKDELQTLVDKHKIELNSFLEKQLNKPYDFIAFFKMLPYLLSGRRFFKPKKNTKYFYCSELIAEAFEIIGIKNTRNNSSQITPSDIFRQDWFKERILYKK